MWSLIMCVVPNLHLVPSISTVSKIGDIFLNFEIFGNFFKFGEIWKLRIFFDNLQLSFTMGVNPNFCSISNVSEISVNFSKFSENFRNFSEKNLELIWECICDKKCNINTNQIYIFNYKLKSSQLNCFFLVRPFLLSAIYYPPSKKIW